MRFLSYKLPAKAKGSKAIIALAGFIKRSQFDLNQRLFMFFLAFNSTNVKYYRKIS